MLVGSGVQTGFLTKKQQQEGLNVLQDTLGRHGAPKTCNGNFVIFLFDKTWLGGWNANGNAAKKKKNAAGVGGKDETLVSITAFVSVGETHKVI